MKSVLTLLVVAMLGVTATVAQERRADAEPARETPAHTPEWTDHNDHDPGEKTVKIAAPKDTEDGEVSPSQNKVLATPSAAKSEGDADKESGAIRFGDGKHGRIPSQGDGQDDDQDDDSEHHREIILESGDGDESPDEEARQGDPDRPIIGGRVPNPERDKQPK